MLSHYREAPQQIQDYEYDRVFKAMEDGTYDPRPELRSKILNDARTYRRNMITTGFTIGFLGAVGAGVTFSLTAPLVCVIAGGSVILFGTRGIGRYQQAKADVNDDNFGDYLDDDQIDDLDEYQRHFKPKTLAALEAHQFITKLCDEILEPLEEDEVVDTKAEVIEEEKGAPDGAIKTSNNVAEKAARPPLDTENYIKPSVWLDSPAPAPTTDSLGAPVGVGKDIARLEEKQTEDFVFLAKECTTLKGELSEIKNLLKERQAGSQAAPQPASQTEKLAEPESFVLKPVTGSGTSSREVSVEIFEDKPETPPEPEIHLIGMEVESPEFKPEQDITGWTIEDFKKNIKPGDIDPWDAVRNPSVKREAINLVYECQDKYDRNSPEFAVWYVFGIKRSTSKEYKATSAFCKKCIDYWKNALRGK